MNKKIVIGIVVLAVLISADGIIRVSDIKSVTKGTAVQPVEKTKMLTLDETGIQSGNEDWDSFVRSANSGITTDICIRDTSTERTFVLHYDGKYYTSPDKKYNYLLELNGRMPNAAGDSTCVILSNEEYSFTDVSKSIYSSNSNDQIPYELLFFL